MKLFPNAVIDISIHALLAESDYFFAPAAQFSWDFYPRSPCGERRLYTAKRTLVLQISIHALLAESDLAPAPVAILFGISIHALLAESDAAYDTQRKWNTYFYPRSPCGERRRCFSALPSLFAFLSTLSLRRATNSRADNVKRNKFLSTLSLRRATRAANCQQRNHQISIHALLAESDFKL